MSDHEVLDLSTIVERKTVNIRSKQHPGGKLYELIGENEISLYAAAVIESKAKDLADLDPATKPTPAAARKHTAALRTLVEIVMPTLEQGVLRELSDVQLLAIFGSFRTTPAEPEEGEQGNARSGRKTSAA